MTRDATTTTTTRRVRRGGRGVLLLWPLLLLGLLMNAAVCVPSVAALEIPWQQYLEVLGFYSGLGCTLCVRLNGTCFLWSLDGACEPMQRFVLVDYMSVLFVLTFVLCTLYGVSGVSRSVHVCGEPVAVRSQLLAHALEGPGPRIRVSGRSDRGLGVLVRAIAASGLYAYVVTGVVTPTRNVIVMNA